MKELDHEESYTPLDIADIQLFVYIQYLDCHFISTLNRKDGEQ